MSEQTISVLTRDSDTVEVVNYVKGLALPAGTHVEVIGVWTWITFPAKPSAEIREQLMNAGFHWNHKRSCWQHPGGQPCRGNGKSDPRFTYESAEVTL